MGGTKGYSVRLSSEQIRQNELERRWRTSVELADQVERTRAQFVTLGIEMSLSGELAMAEYPPSRISKLPEHNIDSIDAFSRSVTTVLEQARRAIADRSAAEIRGSLAESLGTSEGIRVSNLGEVVVRDPVPARESESTKPAEVKSEILLNQLASTGESRDALATRIEAAAWEGVDERGWLTLARDVTAAARAESDRIERDGVADELRVLVARIEDEAVTSNVLDRIDTAPTRLALESRSPEILDTITVQERFAEFRYILSRVVEVWRELGYEVAADLKEVVVDGSATLLFRDDWPDHALQVRFTAGRHELATNVVSSGDTSPERDREVERDPCSSAPEFTEGLADRGVQIALVRAKPTGALPVQQISDELTRSRRRTPTKRTIR